MQALLLALLPALLLLALLPVLLPQPLLPALPLRPQQLPAMTPPVRE